MDEYTQFAHATSKALTKHYSTSFSSATALFSSSMQGPVYDIYGLVRIADEIVDTYNGKDMVAQLDALETETIRAIKSGYSSNIIVHAFAVTAIEHSIGLELIAPFFASMRLDAQGQKRFTQKQYDTYIFGSAEVVGLMCLKIFAKHSTADYDALKQGAQALGAAFQKINFLRDIASDYTNLGRYYFPQGSFETFNDEELGKICADIHKDLSLARTSVVALPKSVRAPVAAAYNMYVALLHKLESSNAKTIKSKRIRVPNYQKAQWLLAARAGVIKDVS